MTKIPFLQPWKVSMCRIKHASAVKIGDSMHSGCFNIQIYLLVASHSEKACQTYLWNPWKRLESIACQVGILAVSRRWPTWHTFLRLCCLPCFLHTQARPLIASIGYTSTVHCPLHLTSFNNFKKMSRAFRDYLTQPWAYWTLSRRTASLHLQADTFDFSCFPSRQLNKDLEVPCSLSPPADDS